jgi:thiol-disulfide isomerase/thioredoxin
MFTRRTVPPPSAERGDGLVLYYFARAGCHACAEFQPQLDSWYTTAKASNPRLRLVIVCRDDPGAGLWSRVRRSLPGTDAIPWDRALVNKYAVSNVPALVLTTPEGAHFDVKRDVRAGNTLDAKLRELFRGELFRGEGELFRDYATGRARETPAASTSALFGAPAASTTALFGTWSGPRAEPAVPTDLFGRLSVRAPPSRVVPVASHWSVRPRTSTSLGTDPSVRGDDPVLYYFAAMWCESCRDLKPSLSAWYAIAKKTNPRLKLVLVSRDKTQQEMDAHRSSLGADRAMRLEEHPDLAGKYGVTGLPTLVLTKPSRGGHSGHFSPAAVRRYVATGYTDDADLRQYVTGTRADADPPLYDDPPLYTDPLAMYTSRDRVHYLTACYDQFGAGGPLPVAIPGRLVLVVEGSPETAQCYTLERLRDADVYSNGERVLVKVSVPYPCYVERAQALAAANSRYVYIILVRTRVQVDGVDVFSLQVLDRNP